MTYAQAYKAIWKVGAAHAQGEPLKAMYARTIADSNCLNPATVYKWMQKHLGESPKELMDFWAETKRDTWLAVTVTLNDMPLAVYKAKAAQ